MDAWPHESTHRSRSGQCGSLGSCFMCRVNSAYASGARAIGVPGWPEFAFCTASMDSVRTVLIESRSRSETGIVGRLGWRGDNPGGGGGAARHAHGALVALAHGALRAGRWALRATLMGRSLRSL